MFTGGDRLVFSLRRVLVITSSSLDVGAQAGHPDWSSSLAGTLNTKQPSITWCSISNC